MSTNNPNTRRFAEFLVSMRRREIPPEVFDSARLCLADWMGVALGAKDEPAAHVIHETCKGWSTSGRATVLRLLRHNGWQQRQDAPPYWHKSGDNAGD